MFEPIRAAAKAHLNLDNPKIRRIGAGENNVMFKVNEYVFRIGLRIDLEKNMKLEYKALCRLPKGIGPEPILHDSSKKYIERPFTILKYVKGKHVKRWTIKHLKEHAKMMATLHKKKYPYYGHNKSKNYNFLRKYRGHMKEYQKEFDSIPELKRLRDAVDNYIQENNDLFKLKKFSMTHGDPASPNVLLTSDGMKLIDWEWACIGDPAGDISRFYLEDIAMKPWSMKLNGSRLKAYYQTYLRICKDPTLKKRVKVFQAYNKIFALVFCYFKLNNWHKEVSEFSKKHYKDTAKMLTKSLQKQF